MLNIFLFYLSLSLFLTPNFVNKRIWVRCAVMVLLATTKGGFLISRVY